MPSVTCATRAERAWRSNKKKVRIMVNAIENEFKSGSNVEGD